MNKMFGTGELTQSCKNWSPIYQNLLLKMFSTIKTIPYNNSYLNFSFIGSQLMI